MNIGIAREIEPGETRVAVVPDEVKALVARGCAVFVEAGAGAGAYYADDLYAAVGATVVDTAAAVYERADVLLRINTPTPDEIGAMRRGTTVFGFLWPLQNHDLVKLCADGGVTTIATDSTPRISRAQSMDARSAMMTVSGYKAVLAGANRLGKFCPLLMTAAGTIRPSRALILGAGVAGLFAIGTARRLGAVVEAFDVRPAVKEQVESLGAKFIEFVVADAEDEGGYAKALDQDQQARQHQLIHEHIVKADLVVTTALIPGQPAPVLITDEMLRDMRAGSVIVDLATETGGNCVASKPDEEVIAHGVIILGPTNLPAALPVHASQMYSKVVKRLLDEATDGEGNLHIDLASDIIGGCCITHAGEIVHPATRSAMGLPAKPDTTQEEK